MADAGAPKNEPKGFRFTLATLLAGMIGLCLVTVFVIKMFQPSCDCGSDNRAHAWCQNNLSQMYRAMHVYRSAFGKNQYYMPHTGDAFWTCLLGHPGPEHPASYPDKSPCRDNKDLFVCYSSGSDESSVTPGGSIDDYRGPKRHPQVPPGNPSALMDGIPPNTVICCDEPANHRYTGGHVLYFDGTIEFLEGDAYQAVLKQTE